MQAPQYHETLFSRLYPGKQQSSPTYLPLVEALESCLAFSPEQKARTILRTDAGFWNDRNVNTVLRNGWQVMSKSSGGRRPLALARQVAPDRWTELRPNDRWVAKVAAPVRLCRPVQWLALRWRTASGTLKHSAVVCSVCEWSPREVIARYDARGACETEFQADKGGLQMGRRRKKRKEAQEALILLTDLAHNLLAWSVRWMFADGALAQLGPTQMVQDVLAIPGHLLFVDQQLVEVRLNRLHPYAPDVADGLERLLDHFGYP